MFKPSRSLRTIVTALSLGAGALTPALAAFHLVAIQEVFVGPPSDMLNPGLTPDQRAQYVMMRMTSSGQTLINGVSVRVEDASGNILGSFGTFTANLANGGGVCSYPTCPAFVIGTTAAKNLFSFNFDQIVNGQAARVALPVAGGRACLILGTSLVDCVAWGTFSCTAANCPGGTNAFHTGDANPNLCSSSFGTPAAPGGLAFGHTLSRVSFNCASRKNLSDFGFAFPKPVNNAGSNDNTDTDADGLINRLDCNTANSAIQWAPLEVQHLTVTLAGAPTSSDAWDSQASFVGIGVTYDEIRGTLSHLFNFTDESCHAPATAATSSTDTDTPPADDGFYYLVRANGGTGCIGSYGLSSAGSPRDPLLTACP
jgi:hypothetical protein